MRKSHTSFGKAIDVRRARPGLCMFIARERPIGVIVGVDEQNVRL